MADSKKTVQELKDIASQFIKERDWVQYHSPKNLSMNISIEAAELMEKFLWITTQESIQEVDKNRQEIADELADVLFGVLCFADVTNIDLSQAFEHKLAEAAKKYPIDKVKGKHEKYTHYK
jgi:NTP pyrophosphatase (non-canonical NTP hydrolase)